MRGGTANCTVKYSNDGYIYNPSPETPDLLLAMNEPSLIKFLPTVAPGGTVLIGDTVEIPEGARQDVTYVKVNCTEIATSLGNPKGANIVMTGAIIKLMGDFTHDAAATVFCHHPPSPETSHRCSASYVRRLKYKKKAVKYNLPAEGQKIHGFWPSFP